jgi:hypothetical protein
MTLSVSKLYSIELTPGIIRNTLYTLRRTCQFFLQQVVHDAVH